MIDRVDQLIIEEMAGVIRSLIDARDSGHCAVVRGVVGDYASALAIRAHEEASEGTHVWLVSENPTLPHEISPTKAVEERNAASEAGFRLCLIAPSRSAVEDSLDASTFEIVDSGERSVVFRSTAAALRASLPPDVEVALDLVLALTKTLPSASLKPWSELRYAARVALADHADRALGESLPELGLLPDSRISSTLGRDQMLRAISHNASMMDSLTSMSPVSERLRTLPADVPNSWLRILQQALSTAGSIRDAGDLARVIESTDGAHTLDMAEIEVQTGTIEGLRVVRFSKDIIDSDGWILSPKAKPSLGVRIECRPPPKQVIGLKEIVVSLVQSNDGSSSPTGYERAIRGTMPAKTTFERSIRVDRSDLDPGHYRFRLIAFGEQNEVLADHTSEQSFAVDDQPIPPETELAASYSAIAYLARAVGATEELPRITISQGGTRPTTTLKFDFDSINRQWAIESPRLLWSLESSTILDPHSYGRWLVDTTADPEIIDLIPTAVELIPRGLASARNALMAKVATAQLVATNMPLLALCDLREVASEARAYIEEWTSALGSAAGDLTLSYQLLSLDHVTVRGLGNDERARLVGPFHPMRLAWSLGFDAFIREAAEKQDAPANAAILRALARFSPDNLPMMVADTQDGWLRFVEGLPSGWSLFLSVDSPDTERSATAVRRWMGMERSSSSLLKSADIRKRIDRYLDLHPYVEQLLVNVIRPGDGSAVLNAIINVASDAGNDDVRFVVRLFDDAEDHDFGQAFDAFMAGETTSDKAAIDRFHTASGSILYPALTFAKHQLGDIVSDPDEFPAHLTVFLDYFRAGVETAAPAETRSFYADDLLVRPALSFEQGSRDVDPIWTETLGSAGGHDAQGLIPSAVRSFNEAVVCLRTDGADGHVPALVLRLDDRDQRLLSAVHRRSDWVVVIDPIFSDAYVDRPSEDESRGPMYLLDHISERTLSGSRRVTVSTQSRDHFRSVLKPIAENAGMQIDQSGAERLMNGLNLLGAGLVLRLVERNTRAIEALSLGAAALFLNASGILKHALAIPLDLYQGALQTPGSGRRADLLLIRPRTSDRKLETAVIEVKARSTLRDAAAEALVDDVMDQLINSRNSLLQGLFSQAGSAIEAAANTDRLRVLLGAHLERAQRFGLIEPDKRSGIAAFIDDLDAGFSLDGPALGALIFDLDGEGVESVQAGSIDDPATVWRIGRNVLDGLIGNQYTQGSTVALGDLGGFDVDTLFADARRNSHSHPPLGGVPPSHPADQLQEPERTTGVTVASCSPPLNEAESAGQSPSPVPQSEDAYVGPAMSEVAIIGGQSAKQFGIVGTIAHPKRPIAVDTDGTSVISVFGAQGSGKSYTLGTLIEAALLPDPMLTKADSPLSGLVFHYSQDPDYAPEFTSMALANDDPGDIEALAEIGTVPRPLESVLVLTPASAVVDRQAELPHCTVAPLQIGTSELTADHWRLLMGLEGAPQVYARELGRLLGSLRTNVTFASLSDAIAESDLSPTQKRLAQLRLRFVRDFVSDESTIEGILQPGRLVVVDLRDEYVDKDQALSVFMVVLDLLTGRRSAIDAGNRLVVFDEAHKYIQSGALTDRLLTKIREMRHLGTTVIVASQDPPSLPASFIELSTALIAHRFTSPQWLSHLKRYSAGFADHAPAVSDFARLAQGEAFVYATVGDDVFGRPQRTKIRPRLTRHGGGTKRASDAGS